MRNLLFLDFDGVLHPEDDIKTSFFCNMPYFLDFLQHFPEVEIVLHTTWLLESSLAQLKKNFPEEIQYKIIDSCTPTQFDDNGGYLDIKNFINNKYPHSTWLAINDKKHLFIDHFDKVFFCESIIGLDDFSLMGLKWKAKSIFK